MSFEGVTQHHTVQTELPEALNLTGLQRSVRM